MLRSSSLFTQHGQRSPSTATRTRTSHEPSPLLSTRQSRNLSSRLSRSLTKVGHELRDFAFPPGCHACDNRLSARKLPQLCYQCSLSIEDHWYAQCTICCETEASGCRCTKEAAPFTRLLARCVDVGAAATLLRNAKDRHQEEVVRTMAALMLQDTRVAPLISQSSALVAVPSSLPNRVRRGFDLGGDLAWYLSDSTGLPLHENLLKRRSFQSQRLRKRREDRFTNPNDFYAARGALKGIVGLIDDIAVTNQTVRSAATALLRAGASDVWVWTFSKRLNTKTTEALTKE